MTYPQVLKQLRAKANPDDAAGMARFGTHPKQCLGIRIPVLRKLAIEETKHLARLDSPSAKWIARDALRELDQIHFQ